MFITIIFFTISEKQLKAIATAQIFIFMAAYIAVSLPRHQS